MWIDGDISKVFDQLIRIYKQELIQTVETDYMINNVQQFSLKLLIRWFNSTTLQFIPSNLKCTKITTTQINTHHSFYIREILLPIIFTIKEFVWLQLFTIED